MTTARTCSTPTGARCLVSGIRAVPALRTRALVQAPVPGRCFLLTVQRQSALSVSSTPVRHHVCQLYTGTSFSQSALHWYVIPSVSSIPVRHDVMPTVHRYDVTSVSSTPDVHASDNSTTVLFVSYLYVCTVVGLAVFVVELYCFPWFFLSAALVHKRFVSRA